MSAETVKKINFFNLSPYVRYIQENSNPDTNKVPPRIIYDHEIVFFTEGEGYYKIEGQEFILKPGDLHFVRPYVLNSSLIPIDKPFH